MAERQASRRVDQPEPGFFATRLVKGGPRVGARIVFENGLWSALIDAEPCGVKHHDPVLADGVFRIWNWADQITEADYGYLIAMKEWALEHDRSHPAANPRKSIDLRVFDPLF